MNNTFDQLVDAFKRFPGIGLRQAKRFVYFLLQQDEGFIQRFTQLVKATRSNMHQCSESFQYFFDENPAETLSQIVRNSQRTKEKLMIVIKDMDLQNIEATHVYSGQYFVLGNNVPMIAENVQRYVRVSELLTLIEKRATSDDLKEIIFATPANPEGDHTRTYLIEKVKPLAEQFELKVSTLGRGLSTGTELEYIDSNTLQDAFDNRK